MAYLLIGGVAFFLLLRSFFDFYIFRGYLEIFFSFDFEFFISSLFVFGALLVPLFLKDKKRFIYSAGLSIGSFGIELFLNWDYTLYLFENYFENFSWYFLLILFHLISIGLFTFFAFQTLKSGKTKKLNYSIILVPIFFSSLIYLFDLFNYYGFLEVIPSVVSVFFFC